MFDVDRAGAMQSIKNCSKSVELIATILEVPTHGTSKDGSAFVSLPDSGAIVRSPRIGLLTATMGSKDAVHPCFVAIGHSMVVLVNPTAATNDLFLTNRTTIGNYAGLPRSEPDCCRALCGACIVDLTVALLMITQDTTKFDPSEYPATVDPCHKNF